jgi:2,3-dihydroxy-2,3-dihydrophenylpropionate dehydrogenase
MPDVMANERRSVIVTGGASGIGLAVVRAFNTDGFATVSLDTTESAEASISVQGDVRDPRANSAAVDAAIQETGRLDALVANAGIHDGGIGLDVEPGELLDCLRLVLDVDVIGYALAAQAAAPALRETRGHVVLTLSDASFLVGQQGAGLAYTAAKHAALGLLGWLARALAPEIRVNGIAPGGVVTDLRAVGGAAGGRRIFEDVAAKTRTVRERNPLGTMLTADDVAEYYRWIVSDRAPGLTGQVIRPDGGLTVR